jgi:hypothetical protein
MEKETTMLKTISAALVAVSVLAAPALAGTTGKTVQTAVNKTAQAPVVKAEQGKTKALNSNAKMGRHHKHIGLNNTHAKPHVAVKHVKPAAKRSST